MAIDPNIESNNWFLDGKNQRNHGIENDCCFMDF